MDCFTLPWSTLVQQHIVVVNIVHIMHIVHTVVNIVLLCRAIAWWLTASAAASAGL